MKLVFVNRFFHPDESATSQLLTDLCEHLSAGGHEVHVVTSRQLHVNPRANLSSEAMYHSQHVHRVWSTRFGRFNLLGRTLDYLTFYLAAGIRLLRLVRRADIVVAKTDPPLISVIAAWICRRKGARLVNWVQDLFPEVAQRLGVRAASGPTGIVLKTLRDYSLRTACANVALGELMATRLRLLAPSSRVEVLHNWSDGAAVRPLDAAQNPLRVEWGLGDRFVVGYSGNMGRAHEFQTILDGCEALNGNDEIVFLFVGAGPQHEWFKNEVVRRRLRNVVFRPFQPRERLAQSLSVADIHLIVLQAAMEGLIVPSKFYGIAAAGRGTIFVGSPEGEIPRLLRQAECGIAIESGDSHTMVQALVALARSRNEARDMGKRARDLFEREFDIAHAVRRWETLLRSL